MKIVDYYIVESDNKEYIIKEINTLIKKGWQPFGNLIMIGTSYTQALVKFVKYQQSI
jgi:hypothetical protein